jgi:iron complex outermembrane receptor protein
MATGPLQAQTSSAAVLRGTILDPAGSAVPNAAVLIRDESSKIVARGISDPQGQFSIPDVPPGTYTVEVSAEGFALANRSGVTLPAGQAQELSVSLELGTVSQAITVEAESSGSIAAQLAPMDGLLEAHSARTEITPVLVQNYASPVADFGELVEMAPGTFNISTNGIGLAQDKTYFRGFPDGKYDIDFDGVPFYDTNDPTHHTWAFFPPPWVGSVDFDRSPGSASTIGPTPFGGSIHLLSPDMSSAPLITGSVSYGSFNTLLLDGHFDSGPFSGRKSNLSADVQHMTSDGYQTFNYQTRNAGSLKYVYKFSDNNVLTGYSGVVWLDSNTPNNNPTRAQIAKFGDNFLSTNSCSSVSTCTDPLYYKFYTYHVPTDFEYIDWARQFGHGWQLDFKPYTLSYYNAQFYDNPSYNADGLTFAVAGGSTIPGIGPVSAVDKLNSYRKYGENLVVSQPSKYGILRIGLWYEWAKTNRFQTPSNPQTRQDANLPNFHENFWTNSAQPFIEYEYRVTPKLTVTGGFKYAYFNQDLKQYQDNGKTVGCLGGTLVGNPKNTPAVSCAGGSPFTTHSASYSSYLPSFDVNFRLLSRWSVYGQYGTGTIVPPSSVFDVTGANVLLTPKPTGATTFQAGSVVKLKNVTLNGDVFHTLFQNTYVAIPDPNNPSAVDYTSSGNSITQGFEGEANVYVTRGFGFYVNGTAGSAKYVTNNLPSKGLRVANAPADTEALGLTYHQKYLDLGIFDKRVGDMWNDNSANIVVPARSSVVITNPAGYATTFTNSTSASTTTKITANQVIPIAPFNVANFYVNFTVRKGSRFDGTKIRFTVNNLFNSHALMGDSQATAGTTSNPWLYTNSVATGGAYLLTLMAGRSFMGTVTFGLSLKNR